MASFIDALEPRQLFAGGPTLTGVELLGSVGNVNSIVLTFSGALDPTTAQQVKGYAFGKPNPASGDSGFDIVGAIFGFHRVGHEQPAAARPRPVKGGKIQFASAVWDSSQDTVTLTPIRPFRATPFFRVLRIRGTGTYAVKDTAGNPFNNGADDVLTWRLKRGKVIRYVDGQKNHVTITLKGKGTVYAFLNRTGEPDPTIFIDNANASTVVTASVIQDHMFSATTPIAEVNGGQGFSDGLLNNPSFIVQTTTP